MHFVFYRPDEYTCPEIPILEVGFMRQKSKQSASVDVNVFVHDSAPSNEGSPQEDVQVQSEEVTQPEVQVVGSGMSTSTKVEVKEAVDVQVVGSSDADVEIVGATQATPPESAYEVHLQKQSQQSTEQDV